MYALSGNDQAGTYIFSHIFRPFWQNAIFITAYTLPFIKSGKSGEMKLYHSRKDSYAGTYTHIHTYSFIYIYLVYTVLDVL
jgi:hypothetical protein